MDSVNNRALFRRKSQAARDKVREMGGVPQNQPQGILASFQDLMEVASRDRARNLMPAAMQQVQPMQAMPMQGPMMQQQQPVRMQVGGDVALETFRQTAAMPQMSNQRDPGMAAEILAAQQSAMSPGVDITATPTPRPRVQAPTIEQMVRANLGDNEVAQTRFDQLRAAIADPNADPEQVQAEVTDAAGLDNTTENFRSVAEQITGRELPSSATVDQINDAITGVALGGAIGGPRSVAERISNALLVGLQAKRETATAREDMEARMAIAAAGAGEGGVGSRDFRNPADAYQDAYRDILNSLKDFDVPEGQTKESYARTAALDIIRNSYTPGQLTGTQFEGIHSGGAAAPQGGQPQGRPVISTQEEFDALPSGAEYIDSESGTIGRKP